MGIAPDELPMSFLPEASKAGVNPPTMYIRTLPLRMDLNFTKIGNSTMVVSIN
jgi:hypothetical protein